MEREKSRSRRRQCLFKIIFSSRKQIMPEFFIKGGAEIYFWYQENKQQNRKLGS